MGIGCHVCNSGNSIWKEGHDTVKKKLAEVNSLRSELRIWQAHVREQMRQLAISVAKCKLIAARMRIIQRRYAETGNTDQDPESAIALLAAASAIGGTVATNEPGPVV